MNAIITDKIQNSRDLISKYLNDIDNIKILGAFEELEFNFIDLNQVDLIIFDINSKNSDEILEKIKKLKKRKQSLRLIATSYEINSELVSKTLKEDYVSDFLLKPIIKSVLEGSIKKIKDINNNLPIQKAKTISVFSSKAGSGKTSIAVNLSYEIAKKTNEKVCLLDLSFNNEDIATFLNFEPKYNMEYILSKIENSNKDFLLSILERYQDTSLYMLSFKENLNFSYKPNSNALNILITALKNIFDWVIIDTTSLLDENSISIFNNSDLIFLISLLNVNSIRNCQKCYELFDKIGYNNDKIKLIVNRFIENSEITINDIEKATGKEVYYKIPNNYLTIVDAINRGETVGKANPQSNIAKAYKNISNEIIDTNFLNLKEFGKTNYNHGMFNLLRRMGE